MTNDFAFDPRWDGRSIPQKHWHFHRQLLARYGIVLAPGEFSQMLRDIKQGRAQLIEMRTRKMGVYSVRLQTQFERIFVLSDGKNVFTAWPPSKRLNEIRRRINDEPVIILRPIVDDDGQ